MRLLAFLAFVLCAAGCSPSGSSSLLTLSSGAASSAETRGDAVVYKVIYSFKFTPDGAWPEAPLLAVSGTLYGTTSMGGSGPSNLCGTEGCGTIFSATTAGGPHSEKSLYSFMGGTDGSMPVAGLTDVGGTLYGTTELAGKSFGTVYQYVPGGKESVLYAFAGSPDGSGPQSGLLAKGTALYGTTYAGGKHSYGSVFKVTTAGKETLVYSFGGPPAGDGAYPSVGVIELNKVLYGTTTSGGASAGGTAYGVSPKSKTEINLYSFASAGGNTMPSALLNIHGTLYGTTAGGGNGGSKCPSNGCGTVFALTPSATTFAFTTVYDFKGGADGIGPVGGLVFMNGKLYGTTNEGGGSTRCPPFGCGTVFSVTTSGTEKVLYKFGSTTDDAQTPKAGLIALKGTLYGTTYGGGTSGFGTIFALTP